MSETLPRDILKLMALLVNIPKSTSVFFHCLKCYRDWDFPGGAVVKNLPANAGDTGSSPGPGRSQVLRSS